MSNTAPAVHGDNFCCSAAATTLGESSAELGSGMSCQHPQQVLVMDGRNEMILEVWAASCKVIA